MEYIRLILEKGNSLLAAMASTVIITNP